jgi:hypothetical protein
MVANLTKDDKCIKYGSNNFMGDALQSQCYSTPKYSPITIFSSTNLPWIRTKSHSSPSPNDLQGKSLVPKEFPKKEVKEKRVHEKKVQDEANMGQRLLVASPQLQTKKRSISEKLLTKKIKFFEEINKEENDKKLIISTFAIVGNSSEHHIQIQIFYIF